MRRQSSLFVLAFVGGMAAVSIGLYYAGLSFFNHYQGTADRQQPTVQCSTTGQVHYVTITGGSLKPEHTSAKLCDQLTITNHDAVLRLMAFGTHEHHVPYDGTTEKVLYQGDSLMVTLNQPGNFTFHDHLHDTVVGTFTVIQ